MTSFLKGRAVRALTHVPIARAIAAVACAGLLAVACDVHGPSEVGGLAAIVVSPNPQTLVVGGAQQFTAVGTDFSGATVEITPVWSVGAGGTISASGMFTAGTTPQTYTNTVTATIAGLSSSATVIVIAGPLATIAVSPATASMVIGAQQTYTAVGRDASGNVVPIAPSWSVVAGGGTINITSGLFTAGTTAGTYTNTVRASVGGVAGFASAVVTNGPLATITVTPNPDTLITGNSRQFVAVGRDAGGNVVTIAPAWGVVNGGGTITASGLFTANAIGTFPNTVRANVGTIAGTATVVVRPVPPALASITVTPNPDTLQVGVTHQFTATGRDGNGNIFPVTPVWQVVNGGGTIDNSGLFTASAVGTFANTIRASSGTIAGTATVTVLAAGPPPVVDLKTVSPNGIMAGQAFTCIINGVINANISISPGSTVTGFPPCIITGVQHLADAVALQAQLDLKTAYDSLAGLACTANIVANLGGTTLTSGVYCSGTSIGVTGNLILDGQGNPNASFVFQAGTDLTTAGNIVLIGQAQARNVFWQVGSSATIGTASQWQGNILALTSITLVDNANLLGRALARNGSVSLGTNNVITLP